MRRLGIWAVLAVAVVLATRTLVYALAPQSALLDALAENRVGPDLAWPLVAIVAGSALLAITALGLAVVAVRERLSLEGRRVVEAPRLRPALLAARAVGLFLVTSFSFAMLESTIHWRDGLGWHGLHCLLGPVHRDAIPVLVALSLVATALHGAVEHLLAWARRLIARLVARRPATVIGALGFPSILRPTVRPAVRANRQRGPPLALRTCR